MVAQQIEWVDMINSMISGGYRPGGIKAVLSGRYHPDTQRKLQVDDRLIMELNKLGYASNGNSSRAICIEYPDKIKRAPFKLKWFFL